MLVPPVALLRPDVPVRPDVLPRPGVPVRQRVRVMSLAWCCVGAYSSISSCGSVWVSGFVQASCREWACWCRLSCCCLRVGVLLSSCVLLRHVCVYVSL